MKKQILTGIIALSTAAGALAQSSVTFDNGNADPAGTLNSANHGSIFVGADAASAVLLNQDINLVLLGGSTAGNMTVIASITGANIAGDNTAFGTPGQFADLSGNVYAVPGVAGGGTAFFQVEAWIGNAADYASSAFKGASAVYSETTGGGGTPAGPPVSIGDNMPSFLVSPVPEPATLALCGLGAASLLLFRRKK